MVKAGYKGIKVGSAMKRMRSGVGFGLLVILPFVFAGCGDDVGTGPGEGMSAGTGDGAGDAGTGPQVVTINMQNIAFVAPGGDNAVTVALGDTIRWVNLDNIPHTTTATSVPAGGNSFNSGVLNNGGVFEFVPNVLGEWVYLCEVHPTIMRDARITVE